MNTMGDLFGMLEPDPRWDPPADLTTSPEAAEKRGGAIREYRIDGRNYVIERHVHKKVSTDDGEAHVDDAPESERTFWRIFVLEGGKKRRLNLLGQKGKGISPDCADIPAELLYQAEQMLEWAAGGMDRARTMAASLRPVIVDDDRHDD